MTNYYEEDGVLYQEFIANGKIFTREYNQPHTHNMSHERIYSIWKGMRRRCNNPNAPKYEYYGGKGVSVCEEWNKPYGGFEKFYEWAMDNGYNDTLTIDRIDPSMGYSPENCRWIEFSENVRRAAIKPHTPKYVYTGINTENGVVVNFYKVTDFEKMYKDIDGRRVSDCCTGRFNSYKGWRFERRPFSNTEGQETIPSGSTREDELPVEVRNLPFFVNGEEDIVHTT